MGNCHTNDILAAKDSIEVDSNNIYTKKLNEVTMMELEMMMSRTRSGKERIMYPFFQQSLAATSPSTASKKASKEEFQKFLQRHHNSSVVEFFHAYKSKPSFWICLRSREFSQEADFLEDFAQLENCEQSQQADQFKKIFNTYIAKGSTKMIHLPADVAEKLSPLLKMGLDDASGRTESCSSEGNLSTELSASTNTHVRKLVCGIASYEGGTVTFAEC